jgi:hypothetical protein
MVESTLNAPTPSASVKARLGHPKKKVVVVPGLLQKSILQFAPAPSTSVKARPGCPKKKVVAVPRSLQKSILQFFPK